MCGIVGILGHHEVAPLLVESLKRLEYRGYDSAGIATVAGGTLDRRRAVGKLVNLSDHLVHHPLPGHAGIGHTRWATHGAPSERNAHPHLSGRVAVVHNGIIENFRALRADLAARGIAYQTDTDTEVIALLTEAHMAGGMDPVAAAFATIDRLEGAWALAFLFQGEDDLIVAARHGSPLAIGHGDGEMFVGSDAIALAPLTDRITYLEEGDRAVVRRSGVTITDARGTLANRAVRTIAPGAARAEKDGHRHFMMKEIAEQPSVLAGSLMAYVAPDGSALTLPALPDFAQVDRVVMVACGTASYACLAAKYWLEQVARLPVEVDIASEGETADTLAALRYLDGKADRTVAVVNVPESSIARGADVVIPILAGPEIGVASTKAFTGQLLVLLMIALKAARDRGHLDDAGLADRLSRLRALPGLMADALDLGPRVADVARKLAEARDVLFLGRGPLYPLALEGALKLKEISYIHAEGYASGELKHGPIALIDKTVPVIVFAPRDALFDKTVSNMQEVIARGGRVILVTDAQGATEAGEGAAEVLVMPDAPALLAPILYAIPAQLIAYHTAVAKGTDVDQPRNLAKSVTVE
ncbi:MAG: glutamine--fructose-6-phosphate aminotransferase [Rhodobacteraceae bacterium]|nr:glutamine--fructose-6-phosphate aminotransferase [Paracoccaceae bacterium]